jgi:DNA-binding MarR family transcriptional regulator
MWRVKRYHRLVADIPAGSAVDRAVVDIDRAMVRIRRSQSRRALGRRSLAERGMAFNLGLVQVADAVEEGPSAEGPVTVGLVGERLGLDQSRASRLVAAAVEQGYVRRVASQSDGRRIHLELTAAGQQLVAEVHAFRQAHFARILADWSARDREQLARLLLRFVDALAQAS